MVGEGIDGVIVGQRTVGDEALVTVDDELVVLTFGEGLQAADVGARVVLGQAEGAEVTVAQDGGHEALALLLGGVREVQAAAVEGGGDGEGNGQGSVHLGDLLDGESVFHIAEALAAELLGIGQADEAHLGHLLIEGDVVLAGLVALEDLGGDLLLGEITGHLLDRKLLFVQFKIHDKAPFSSGDGVMMTGTAAGSMPRSHHTIGYLNHTTGSVKKQRK